MQFSKYLNTRFWFVLAFILVAAVIRILPHAPNFSPVTALALFGGALIARKTLALCLPLLAMILSDLVLGFHSGVPSVYGAFALVAIVGFGLRERRSVGRLALSSLSGTMIFFFVTNFAVWTRGTLYPLTWTGLVECYVAAIPFLRNAALGDALFTFAIFGSWAWLERTVPQIREPQVVRR